MTKVYYEINVVLNHTVNWAMLCSRNSFSFSLAWGSCCFYEVMTSVACAWVTLTSPAAQITTDMYNVLYVRFQHRISLFSKQTSVEYLYFCLLASSNMISKGDFLTIYNNLHITTFCLVRNDSIYCIFVWKTLTFYVSTSFRSIKLQRLTDLED